MIFLDEPNKRVILSARKCGLISLSHAVTSTFKNKSENIGLNTKNLDPHLYKEERSNHKMFDKESWKDYDVVLVIRDPFNRYISGLRTLWALQWITNEYMPFVEWFKIAFKKTQNMDLNNGHCSNWLYQTENMKCKSLEIVDTLNLTEWLVSNKFNGIHAHKSEQNELNFVKEYIQNNHKKDVEKYLFEENEHYNRLTLLSNYSRI